MKTSKEKSKTKTRFKVNTALIVLIALAFGILAFAAGQFSEENYFTKLNSVAVMHDGVAENTGDNVDDEYADDRSANYCYFSDDDIDKTNPDYRGYAICNYSEEADSYVITQDSDRLASFIANEISNQSYALGYTLYATLEGIFSICAIISLLIAVIYYNHNRA